MLRDKSQFDKFNIWLSEQERLSTDLGYVVTDIDCWLRNYKQSKHMFLEKKTYLATVHYSQQKSLRLLDELVQHDPNYYGLHLVQFSKETPQDGDIYLDGKKISLEQFYIFLEFKAPKEWYKSNYLLEGYESMSLEEFIKTI